MAGVDRISALPDEIKVSILSRLSITEAVRTSVLAHSWRHLWTFRSGLHADLDFEDHLHQPPERLDEISRWIRIVEHLLSSLRGPIRFFILSHFTQSYQPPHLARFLDLIFQKGGLEDFYMSSSNLVAFVQLPYFRSLRFLHLNWVHLCLPPDFQGFDQLITLRLDGVRISQHDINALINRSKKLTHFVGDELIPADYEEPLSVTFNCPLLESVQFNFEMPLAQARIASAPCLESAYLTASGRPGTSPPEELAWLATSTRKFMADVAHVSHLSLGVTVLECLSQINVPLLFRVHFQQLRCLELVGKIFYIDRRMYGMFCHLLRSMPCLEALEIECCHHENGDKRLDELDPIPSNDYMKKQDGFHCLDRTLKRFEVSVVKLIDIDDMMWMMYFILLNAKMLELVEITFEKDNIADVRESIIEELYEVERASMDAEVVLWHQMND